jgi:hypothetical protein
MFGKQRVLKQIDAANDYSKPVAPEYVDSEMFKATNLS